MLPLLWFRLFLIYCAELIEGVAPPFANGLNSQPFPTDFTPESIKIKRVKVCKELVDLEKNEGLQINFCRPQSQAYRPALHTKGSSTRKHNVPRILGRILSCMK